MLIYANHNLKIQANIKSSIILKLKCERYNSISIIIINTYLMSYLIIKQKKVEQSNEYCIDSANVNLQAMHIFFKKVFLPVTETLLTSMQFQ